MGPLQEVITGRLYLLKRGIDNGFPGDAYQVPARLNIIQAEPNRLAHETSGPIALDRIADAFTGRESEPTDGQIIGQGDQDNQAMLIALPLAANLLKAIFGS